MREFCGTAAEYLGCHTLPYELESGGPEIRFEGGLLRFSVPDSTELEHKRIYRPLA